MTRLRKRVRRVRSNGDTGSALAIALVFLMVFGVYVGIVLEFSTTGQRSTLSVRDEGAATYAAGGALEGAINEVAGSSTVGVDPGTSSPPVSSPCFTLPAGELDNPAPITVECQPRENSGAVAGSPASQPGQALLALSGHPAEGVALTGSADVSTDGSVHANRLLDVPGGARLTSSTEIKAGTCSVAGTATPACVTGPVPGDPGWGGPTTYPEVVTSLPSCSGRVARLDPGTYLSRTNLQRVINCANTVVWFTPGVYYFDFRDGNRELVIGNGDVVVGGTPSGWVPGTTPSNALPVPTAANPDTSACDENSQGVDFVFGDDSRIDVRSRGSMQLCAERTGSTSQHVVLRGLATTSAPLPAAVPSAGAATRARQSGSGTRWSQVARGAVVDGRTARVVVPAAGSSRTVRIGPFPADLVPPEATGISVTVTATHSRTGSGTTRVRVTDGGGTALPWAALAPDDAVVTGPALTPTLVNAMYVEIAVTGGGAGTTTETLDGITVAVDFSAPMRPTSGTGSATPYGAGAPTALLSSAGSAANTVLALHGTVYAPLGAVDLAMTNVPYEVIDRGIVARHLRLAMTSAPGYAGALVSVPALARSPRVVILVAQDAGGGRLARALVRFTDPSGPGPAGRAAAEVLEWSVD